MKTKLILAAVCCLPLGVLAQKGFSVRGKIGTLNAPVTAYLSYTNNGERVRDSVVLKKGSFAFKGTVSEPVMAEILLKRDTISIKRNIRPDVISFYLENSVITLTAKDSIQKAVVKGSVTNEEDREIYAMRRPYREISQRMVAEYNAKTPEERKDSTYLATTRGLMQKTQKGYDSVSHVFIRQHPNSYISLGAFKEVELAYNFNADTAAAKFTLLSPGLRESPSGKKLQALINTGMKTSIGKTAIDFIQKDSTGKEVKLSDFRGQYVLLDFWASWCKPCRAENPNMLKAYNKYKADNFTILGVSLDDDNGRRAWLHAVAQDGLPWTQVSSLQGFKTDAAVLYGVLAIPSNFLIDPKGTIIGRNLRGEELEKKLSEVFSK